MTTIYIIRHGETNSNIRHACVGRKDVPLNEKGIEQAEQLADRLKTVSFDTVYSSPLCRAVDTIEPVMKKGKRLIMNYDLIERDFGDWDDMTFAEIKESDPVGYAEWKSKWTDFVIPNGESAEQVQRRANKIINKIINEHKGENVALATHLCTARHIISGLLGLSTAQSWLFTLDNARYAVISVDDKGKALLKGLNL